MQTLTRTLDAFSPSVRCMAANWPKGWSNPPLHYSASPTASPTQPVVHLHTTNHTTHRTLSQVYFWPRRWRTFSSSRNMEPQNSVPSQVTLPALLECLPDPFRPLLAASTLNGLRCASKELCLMSPKLADGLKIDLTKKGV